MSLLEEKVVEMPSGTLEVRVQEQLFQHLELDDLCDFAARNNPKRGFLVVSKVLGRHIATPTSTMHNVHQALATLLTQEKLPGPVVFLAMAETATCLGQGIHDYYDDSRMLRCGCRHRSEVGSMFLHSTRQMITINGETPNIITEFSEPHSHAARHIVYQPLKSCDIAMLKEARTLVLIDDESSTGTTFRNAAEAMAQVMPSLENVTTAVITDWSNGNDWRQGLPWKGMSLALLNGTLKWVPREGYMSEQAPLTNTGALGSLAGERDYGRRGTVLPDHDLSSLHVDGARTAHQSRLRPYEHIARNLDEMINAKRYLIVGTGEFTYPAFQLASALTDRGCTVHVQATTRSPVHIGGAIQHKLEFADNYGTDVPNFLYNVFPSAECQVIICHETPDGSIDPKLINALDAIVINFNPIV